MKKSSFQESALDVSTTIGFDPLARRWVHTQAGAATPGGLEPIPDLDGVLLTDDAALGATATDEGNLVHRNPSAVLHPASIEDISRMLRFCRQHGLLVAPRGQGHSMFGQSLVNAGLVVNTRGLATIHRIGTDYADVDAGVLWKELITQTVAQGTTPPVFTGYTALTVGGTLSLGGVGVTPRKGVQIELVRQLQVVTGEGEIVWCSLSVNPDLFHGMLAGVGQLGILTRAVLDLEAAPAKVSQWTLTYTDPHVLFRDLLTILDRGELEVVYGQVITPPIAPSDELSPTPWIYQLQLAKYHEDGQQPDADHLLRGLSDLHSRRMSIEWTYLDFVLRIDAKIEFLKAQGKWTGVPHPWVDVFLPGQEAEDFIADTFSQLKHHDLGEVGYSVIFAIKRSMLTRRYFAVPESETEWIFLFDLLTAAPSSGSNSAFVTETIRRNRVIYERAHAVGGTLYPISAVEMQPADWARQYGPRFRDFAALKNRYDPARILTPGVRIF